MPQLASKRNCTGCTACMNACPKQCILMKQDDSGFLYPEINLSECTSCGGCERVCPILLEKKEVKTLPRAFAAYSTDENMRLESSSGGIFSELSNWIFEKGGVVYGAAYNECFEIQHICVENKDDLSKLRGAKYAQSLLGITFREIRKRLLEGQFVLFSGTPCQVSGLKAFLRKDYENLVCVDFVCHGVPSPMVWREYIKYRMKEDEENIFPIMINLREKNTGWSRYGYCHMFRYADGKVHRSKNGDSLFMKLFINDYINRESCSECHFKGYNRESDITLGDFWGIWDIIPKMDDNKGTSVILIQSEKGNQIWRKIQNNIRYMEVSLEQASRDNPSMLISSEMKKKREKVLLLIKDGKFSECQKLFEIQKTSVLISTKNKIRNFIKNIKKKDVF